MKYALMGILVAAAAQPALGAEHPTRIPVLEQVKHPHTYYWREMYMPQLTSGPSAATFSPDGKSVIYSMQGSLWRQAIGDDTVYELTAGAGYDYQPDWSPDGRHVVFTRQHGNTLNLMLLDMETGIATA
ncbi:TolB family protein [Kordiimonas gwangyangensis]|nr:PD40 domain-containing protein [Kordiimonas gwangyangensis]